MTVVNPSLFVQHPRDLVVSIARTHLPNDLKRLISPFSACCRRPVCSSGTACGYYLPVNREGKLLGLIIEIDNDLFDHGADDALFHGWCGVIESQLTLPAKPSLGKQCGKDSKTAQRHAFVGSSMSLCFHRNNPRAGGPDLGCYRGRTFFFDCVGPLRFRSSTFAGFHTYTRN